MNSDIPSREFTIPYSIAEVKAAIAATAVVHDNAKLMYSNNDSNEMLGMYKYHAFIGDFATGMSNGDIWINLQDIGKNTKIIVTGVVGGNNALGANRITQSQDYILKLITDQLQGNFNVQTELSRNTGCLGFALLIIVSSLLIYLL